MSCEITLKAKGMKLTPQRRLILDIIHSSGEHLTGDTIVNRVQYRMPGVHKSTIYRTLDLLVGLGCVFKSEMGDKFIYHHADEGHHHHLVCRFCGKTIDCEEADFLPVIRTLDRKYDFLIDLKHLIIKGTCRSCLNKK